MATHGRHQGQHSKYHGAAHEAVKQAGLQGLLAGIPAALLFSARSSLHTHMGRTLNGLLNKGEKYAHEVVSHTEGQIKEGKLAINAPTVAVVGAVLVVGAMLHGAWRGAKRGEERSFVEAENARRAQRGTEPTQAR